MRDAGCLATYVPVDISEQITHDTAESLVEEYPGLAVRGLVCDFEHDLERIPNGGDGRLVAFLGGTIGNLYPDARRDFLARIAALLEPGDRILLGTDLVKESSRLEAAYNDSQGVTSEFNKNVLRVLNRELGADFDLACFEHVARYDSGRDPHGHPPALAGRADRAARRARPDGALRVPRRRCGPRSPPSSPASGLEGVYREAGLRPDGWFTDAAADYALSLASV